MAEKIIKVSSFPYRGDDGVERTALRGDKVDITEKTDLERGEHLGVFATDDDLKEGTVFGDFYATRQAEQEQATAEEDDPSATQPDMEPVVVEPGRNDSREKWVAYARAKGAPDAEVASVNDGGLSRDQLREKYGS